MIFLGDPLSEKPVSRTIAALSTAALLAFGGTSAAALAQEAPASTPPMPTETSAPGSTPAPPPSTEPAAQPPAPPPQQKQEPEQKPSVSGVLYADKNGNGKQDPDEAIPDGKVSLLAGGNASAHEATSDADGRFSFRDLVPGKYQPTYELPDGWVVHRSDGESLMITANTTAELTARAERPYWEQLTATASLDEDNYRHPATATTTLTLTNTTDREISGVQAGCDRRGDRSALGRGPGWAALINEGVTLAAGEQRTLKIVDELPQATREHGVATLDCDFAPHARWNTDGPDVHDHATVTGSGSYTMVIGVDGNADLRIDGNEAVKNTKVVLLRPTTGEKAAEGTSGADGKIEFVDLPVGVYRAVVLGSWSFTDAGGADVRITGGSDFGYRFLKQAMPAELRATMKFDKSRYESHETVRVELTITNIGGQTAERVRMVAPPHNLRIPDEQWGDFRSYRPGLQIPAGESRTLSVSGTIQQLDGGKLQLSGEIDYIGRPEGGDRSDYFAEAEVVTTFGDVTGVVYADKNRNGQLDPGEAAAGALVDFFGGAPHTYLSATADTDGRFSFKGIPSGSYWIHYSLADGWLVHREGDDLDIRVEPGKPVHLDGRAERPYYELLKATAVLDKIRYGIGEEAKFTVTLKNTTNRVISGIMAACNRSDKPGQLGGAMGDSVVSGWDELRPIGKGMTISPGETRTVVATEKVPVGASLFSRVEIDCDFAPNPAYNIDGPRGYDWAATPGGVGSLKGTLAHDRNKNEKVDPGEAIANARVVLRTHRENGANIVETVSDANGNVRFDSVPPGYWWAWVDGPWRFEGEWGGNVEVTSGWESDYQFFVVPGPWTPPGDGGGSDNGTDDGGEGGGGTQKALARTGASVLGLGVVAGLLVAFGIGARIAGRRKT